MNIGLSSGNDIYVVDGDLPLVTGIEEIRQLVGQVLRSSQGDWFLDFDIGLPFFQTIFQKATSISEIENIYLDRISLVPGVLDITKFDLVSDAATRSINIIFTARTSDGVLNFNLAEV